MVAIVVLTAFCWTTGLTVMTVGDLGALPAGLPQFGLPNVPFTLATLAIIAPYSIALAMVGLIESLLTARIIDEATGTDSCKHTESRGQGLANMVAGVFGGMAGCAMIGQSVINVRSGGRGRLSTLVAGVFLLILVVGFGDLVAAIPMPALVAVMFMVAISTFDWSSLKRMAVIPTSDAIVLVVTIGVVLATHDLSKGVLAGVLLSALFFARVVGKLVRVEQEVDEEASLLTYHVHGELFFVSVDDFVAAIPIDNVFAQVVIDLRASHIWDDSAVSAIDKIVLRFDAIGVNCTLQGMNEASAALVSKLGVHDKPGASMPVMGH
jgi:SulP family sulfate permease